jgi:4-hydroxyphenylacetate 3-monooxygenase/4-hydroxybutyryl-CoA dehydratase/vinylacetyl-CoA-Delta-isomerase
METIALNIDFDYEARRKVARYLAGIDKELDQSKELTRQPTFGCNLMQPEDFGTF